MGLILKLIFSIMVVEVFVIWMSLVAEKYDEQKRLSEAFLFSALCFSVNKSGADTLSFAYDFSVTEHIQTMKMSLILEETISFQMNPIT